MLCEPTGRLEVVKVAVVTPPEVLRSPYPITAEPSTKVTLPVGVLGGAAPVSVTVAVNVTDCPRINGTIEDETTLTELVRAPFATRVTVMPGDGLAV
jgi:hypothetical protein